MKAPNWREGLLVLGALAACAVPQHWGLGLVFAAAAATGLPALCAGALLAAWWGTVGSAWGWACLCAAVVLGAQRRSVGLGAIVVILVGRQVVAGANLPGANAVLPELVVLGVLGMGASAAAAEVSRPLRVALGLLAAVSAARMGSVWLAEGELRLRRAEDVGAERLVAGSLLGSSPVLDMQVLLAVQDSDAAAARVGWERALDLGWRPQRPPVEAAVLVARSLDARGRGGEARRLLARFPRVDAVDFLRTAWERQAGEPGDWRGGVDGDLRLTAGGSIPLDWSMLANGVREVQFLAPEGVRARLTGAFDAFEGVPTAEVQLDAVRVRWTPTADLDLGFLAAGPHTLRVVYDTDRHGVGGDRNVYVGGVVGE